MQITKKSAPGTFDAQGANKTVQSDFARDQDLTPEAALSALHASLISATAALKAIGAAIDSLTAIVGRGHG